MSEIPMHLLLSPELAEKIYDEIEGASSANGSVERASRNIQQAVVDFIQHKLEEAAKGGYPFRLVERSA